MSNHPGAAGRALSGDLSAARAAGSGEPDCGAAAWASLTVTRDPAAPALPAAAQ